jgi:AcrR family transcriptional regulator
MTRRAPKTRTEVRQEQIAQAALTLIARRGLNRLNIGAVAKAVGVVPSAVYRHFPGKDGVLGAVLELISEHLLANVQSARQAAADPFERLHLLLRRHVELVRHQAGVPRVLFSEQIFAGHRVRRRRVYQILRQYLDQIAGIIREGQRAGQIRVDLKPDTVALMFLGLVQPAVILWLMSNGAFDVASHVEQAWRLFRSLLQTKATAQEQRFGHKDYESTNIRKQNEYHRNRSNVS